MLQLLVCSRTPDEKNNIVIMKEYDNIMPIDIVTSDFESQLISDPITENIVLEVNPEDYIDTSHQDIFKQISEDLGIPFTIDDVLNTDVFDCHQATPSSTSAVEVAQQARECFSEFFITDKFVKSEPASPESTDSQGSAVDDWTSLLNNAVTNGSVCDWKTPETPPVTPPNLWHSQSPPVSPSITVQSGSDGPCKLSPNNTTPVICNTNPANLAAIAPTTSLSSTVLLSGNSGRLTLNGVPLPGGGGGGVAVPPTSSASLNSKSQSPLMLTPVQKDATATMLNCITAQGVLQFGAQVVTQPQQCNSQPLTIKGILPYGRAVSDDADMKAIKRQQRMIKNRESACLSRKKKKEYVQSLEEEVKEIKNENSCLRSENEQLRNKIHELEKERSFFLQNLSVKSVKKATALLAVIFLISLNLGPLCGIFLSNRERIQSIGNRISSRHGRSLLWASEESQGPTLLSATSNGTLHLNDVNANASPANTTGLNSICPIGYINKTESLRLESDLRGWVFSSDKEEPLDEVPKFKKNLLPMPRFRQYLEQEARTRKRYDFSGEMPDSRELQLYNIPDSCDDFLKAIKYREDTFYVVSLNGDMRIPARAHNKTRRPRMSLVLPAFSLNETAQPPKDHIAMMVIESEVTNTKLIYVPESQIPKHALRKHGVVDNVFQSEMTSQSNISTKFKQKKSRKKVAEKKANRKEMLYSNVTSVSHL